MSYTPIALTCYHPRPIHLHPNSHVIVLMNLPSTATPHTPYYYLHLPPQFFTVIPPLRMVCKTYIACQLIVVGCALLLPYPTPPPHYQPKPWPPPRVEHRPTHCCGADDVPCEPRLTVILLREINRRFNDGVHIKPPPLFAIL